jgi:hypothetical protein
LLAKALGWQGTAKGLYGRAAKYAAGVNIEEYVVEIPKDYHKALHGSGTGMAGSWNDRWSRFFDKYKGNPPSPADIHAHLAQMMDDFGIIHAILK